MGGDVSFAFALERGANVLNGGGVHFSVWAPHADRVSVRLLHDRGPVELDLEPRATGIFERTVPDAGAGTDYFYRLDGLCDRPDPVSRYQPAGVHGPSRVIDPRRYRWSEAGWQGVEQSKLVIYEVHVATFTEAGTFEAAILHLPELCDLGITALELMPVAEFPGERNWGYDGVFPYAPHGHYGGPCGLRRLVDAAHGLGLAVILDVVYNHLGPDGNVLAEFGPYFTDRHRTPWGPAVNLDGPESTEVRRYFRDNALYWLQEYRLDGLRLDAVHAMYDHSDNHFLAELAESVRSLGEKLGRRVHLIAESDLNDPRLVRRRAEGGYGLGAIWNDDFHHAVHAALTGERAGYYVDFGGIKPLAKALSERFVYNGVYSRFRRGHHGAPARDLPTDRFVVFIQNHDQIGNRALGERLSTLVSRERLRLAAALLLLSPYVPLLFMGEEYGETNPFLYFVSHEDTRLIDAIRRGRRQEFAALHRQEAFPDPNDELTFQRSRLHRDLGRSASQSQLRGLYRQLLQLRREEPALRPGATEVHTACDPEKGWIVMEYRPPVGRAAFAAFHLGEAPIEAPAPLVGVPWRLRLATDEAAFGGPGSQARERITGGAGSPPRVLLPAETAVFYISEAA